MCTVAVCAQRVEDIAFVLCALPSAQRKVTESLCSNNLVHSPEELCVDALATFSAHEHLAVCAVRHGCCLRMACTGVLCFLSEHCRYACTNKLECGGKKEGRKQSYFSFLSASFLFFEHKQTKKYANHTEKMLWQFSVIKKRVTWYNDVASYLLGVLMISG